VSIGKSEVRASVHPLFACNLVVLGLKRERPADLHMAQPNVPVSKTAYPAC
jgi:hypothetical protein